MDKNLSKKWIRAPSPDSFYQADWSKRSSPKKEEKNQRMKRAEIRSVEDALKTIEESAILRGIATMNGDSKTGNKYV